MSAGNSRFGMEEFLDEDIVTDCRDIAELRRIVEAIVLEHMLRCPGCTLPAPVLRRHTVERTPRCPHCFKPIPEPAK